MVTEDFDSRQQAQEASRGDWRHLSDQGLVTRETLTDRDGARHVVALTREGKVLLDAHRPVPAKGRPHPRGHLELPDLRIEYETESGRLEHRDVELETEHYSRGQLAGKAKAGFVRYRASGGSGRGGNSRRGGTPVDPHHLERL
ncbi:MAG: hypothetical protein ABI877_09455 [Gemmatimonadaceae bacterium]